MIDVKKLEEYSNNSKANPIFSFLDYALADALGIDANDYVTFVESLNDDDMEFVINGLMEGKEGNKVKEVKAFYDGWKSRNQ